MARVRAISANNSPRRATMRWMTGSRLSSSISGGQRLTVFTGPGHNRRPVFMLVRADKMRFLGQPLTESILRTRCPVFIRILLKELLIKRGQRQWRPAGLQHIADPIDKSIDL